ncbi:hypothetical protein [Burkholderia gladioli]|uniref:hypothetical protein n=1 Tax=Burkholderia gladioli TaxID=28095 RepID=UPI001641CBBB|nr:hypothetical protein [Burkholderia gladioli]
MHSPAKPSLDEVRSFLARHQALIIHYPGTQKSVGSGQEAYLEDLKNVWWSHARGGISCSVVKPGDRFRRSGRHDIGGVGLVIGFTGANSLVAVAAHDAGSFVVHGERLVSEEVDIGIADLERSLSARGDSHNEWVVRNFKVIGVFVAEPATTWREVQMQIPPGLGGMASQFVSQEVSISLSQIAADFKGLPIYTFSEGGILQWSGNGWSPVAYFNIYDTIHEENYRPVIKQHVLPAASIQRFFRTGNSCVEVFLRTKGVSFNKGTSWNEFVEIRKWDEQIEKAAIAHETAFQNLADLIVAGQDTLTPKESLVVERYWAVISERSRARRVPLAPEAIFESKSPTALSNTHLDFLERQGVFLGGTTQQLDRAVYGIAQRLAILKTARTSSSWVVVRAKEGQFLVSDNYHHAKLVPVNPTTYLAPGAGAVRQMDRPAIEKFNKFLLEISERYVFAQNLSDCGVGL